MSSLMPYYRKPLRISAALICRPRYKRIFRLPSLPC